MVTESFQRHGKTAGVFSKGKEDKRKNKHQQRRQPHSTANQHSAEAQGTRGRKPEKAGDNGGAQGKKKKGGTVLGLKGWHENDSHVRAYGCSRVVGSPISNI